LCEQHVERLETQYARSCSCGVVLDTWSVDDGVTKGVAALAARRGTTLGKMLVTIEMRV